MVKKPQNFLALLLAVIIGGYGFFLFTNPVYSDEATDLENQIDEKTQELAEKQTTLSQVEARIKEISGSNYSVSQKISLINAEITKLNDSITANTDALNAKIKEIEDKQALMEQKKIEMDELSTDLYMRSRYRMATFFLSGRDWDILVKEFFLKQSSIAVLKTEVEQINGEFSSLEESRALLEAEKANLEAQKKDMDDSYALLAAEKARLQKELSSQYAQKNALTKQIGGITKELSSLQTYLSLARSGGTVVSASSLVSTSSKGSYQYFLDNTPAGKTSFGIFSFGAFTHRAGMSQWGAKARAEVGGQTYTQILAAYYPTAILNTNYTEPEYITIKGTGVDCNENSKYYNETILFSTYMNRIFEMPSYWDEDAVKAQAVASRSYAIAQYNKNGYVIPSQSDQVYKNCDNASTWISAVNATKNQVLTTSSGSAYKAYFAAVHGGWGNEIGYDLREGSGDWVSRAWDNLSGVTWFYRNWYDFNQYTGSYTPCSAHPNPWLTEAEMADLLNAYKYWIQNGSPASDPRMVSVDTTACWGQASNPYSMNELKNLVNNPVSTISNVVTVNENGRTKSIVFYTNAGVISFTESGDYTINGFREIFKLRSPGYYAIWQNGFTHINIVRIQK